MNLGESILIADEKARIERQPQYIVMRNGIAEPFVTRSFSPTDRIIYSVKLDRRSRLIRSAVSFHELSLAAKA